MIALLKASFPFSKIEAILYCEVESIDTSSTETIICCGVTELMTTHSAVPDFFADNSYPINVFELVGATQIKLISWPSEADVKFLGANELELGVEGFSAEALLEDVGEAVGFEVFSSITSSLLVESSETTTATFCDTYLSAEDEVPDIERTEIPSKATTVAKPMITGFRDFFFE